MPMDEYVKNLIREIHLSAPAFPTKSLQSIYLGGGTPSIIPPQYILDIFSELEKHGIHFDRNSEVTIEINPATIQDHTLHQYLSMGINRFSVGVQTFSDEHLQKLGRIHSSKDTYETLELLSRNKVNLSLDLLFALPRQTMDHLRFDLDKMLEFKPHHISPYCLTLPENHFLNGGRPVDEKQVEMFQYIHERLIQHGYVRYEISNYCLPGYESRHNLLYWSNDSYWGLGLSAHSYVAQEGDWGKRFWNSKSLKEYTSLQGGGFEFLTKNQAMTDYFHTFLRKSKGWSEENFIERFGEGTWRGVYPRIEKLFMRGWMEKKFIRDSEGSGGKPYWSLTEEGILLSNRVFLEMTFLDKE